MYVREVDGQELTLRVSGKLWMRSLVMSDVETKTEWSHLLGRGMKGQLKGKQLKAIVADMVTWSAWREEFPDTTVLDMRNTSRNYTRDFYRNGKEFVKNTVRVFFLNSFSLREEANLDILDLLNPRRNHTKHVSTPRRIRAPHFHL